MQLLWLIAVFFFYCVMIYFQSNKLFVFGSDHSVHLFLINSIRENKHRLFSRVPRLLNESYCGAYPLFLHWLLSFLNVRQISHAAILLNPIVNLLQVLFCYIVLLNSELSIFAKWICLCYALTPQFYHINSARNHGISSRPIGILLMMIFSWLSYEYLLTYSVIYFVLAFIVSYLIWGFNTFALQTMVLSSIMLLIFYGIWQPISACVIGLFMFIFFHRKYALSYIKHTFLFIKTYANDLAKVFILKERYSIWRDLIYDIWLMLFRKPKKAFGYGYNNSFLIIFFLNPLVFVSLFYWITHGNSSSQLISFSVKMTLVSFSIFILTSFRYTRFLGEPERYIEIFSIFSTIVGVSFLFSETGLTGIFLILAYFIIIDIAQLFFAMHAKKAIAEKYSDLSIIEKLLNKNYLHEEIRFSSNNEQLTKILMNNAWYFSRFWSIEKKYGGFKLKDVIENYPYLNKRHFETILRQYQINTILLDKSTFGEIFENCPNDRKRLKMLLDTEKYRLYRIDWRDGARNIV